MTHSNDNAPVDLNDMTDAERVEDARIEALAEQHAAEAEAELASVDLRALDQEEAARLMGLLFMRRYGLSKEQAAFMVNRLDDGDFQEQIGVATPED